MGQVNLLSLNLHLSEGGLNYRRRLLVAGTLPCAISLGDSLLRINCVNPFENGKPLR